MTSFQKILVGTDFSPHADAARDAAIVIAKQYGAEIEIVYALSPPPIYAPDLATIPATIWDDARSAARERLEDEAKVIRDAGVVCEFLALDGPAGIVLPEHAARIRADLIVVGKRGRSRIPFAHLGSVAAKTVRSAPCPVLTIPAGASYEPRTIAVPVDFSPQSDAALDLATGLARGAGAQLMLIHGQEIPDDLRDFLQVQGTQTTAALSDVAKGRLDKMLKDLQDAGVAAEFLLEESSPEHVLHDLVERKVVDLIVMGTHGRTGVPRLMLGSVAERVVRESTCPVITTRDFGADEA